MEEFLYVLADEETPNNAINFFSQMGKGAQQAAAVIGDSAGKN